MSKFLRVFILIIIMLGLVFCSTNLYAVNMNLEENNTINTEETSDNDGTPTENIKQGNFTTQITVSTQELTISNALSICLIAVGIVLILLSIAILIKMKK